MRAYESYIFVQLFGGTQLMLTILAAELVLSLETAISIEAETPDEFRELLIAHLRVHGSEKMLCNLVLEMQRDEVSFDSTPKDTS
jgi:hypothetical protein